MLSGTIPQFKPGKKCSIPKPRILQGNQDMPSTEFKSTCQVQIGWFMVQECVGVLLTGITGEELGIYIVRKLSLTRSFNNSTACKYA